MPIDPFLQAVEKAKQPTREPEVKVTEKDLTSDPFLTAVQKAQESQSDIFLQAVERAGTPKGKDLINIAAGYAGSPTAHFYSPDPTRACASFVSCVLKDAGVISKGEGSPSSTALENSLRRKGTTVVPRLTTLARGEVNLQPGDIIFFQGGSVGDTKHTGIYLGNGQMADTSSKEGKVKVRPISGPGYGLMSAYRLGGKADPFLAAVNQAKDPLLPTFRESPAPKGNVDQHPYVKAPQREGGWQKFMRALKGEVAQSQVGTTAIGMGRGAAETAVTAAQSPVGQAIKEEFKGSQAGYVFGELGKLYKGKNAVINSAFNGIAEWNRTYKAGPRETYWRQKGFTDGYIGRALRGDMGRSVVGVVTSKLNPVDQAKAEVEIARERAASLWKNRPDVARAFVQGTQTKGEVPIDIGKSLIPTAPVWVQKTIDFITDIATDPVNYVPGGVIKKGGTLAREGLETAGKATVTKGKELLTKLPEVKVTERLAPVTRVAEDVIAQNRGLTKRVAPTVESVKEGVGVGRIARRKKVIEQAIDAELYRETSAIGELADETGRVGERYLRDKAGVRDFIDAERNFRNKSGKSRFVHYVQEYVKAYAPDDPSGLRAQVAEADQARILQKAAEQGFDPDEIREYGDRFVELGHDLYKQLSHRGLQPEGMTPALKSYLTGPKFDPTDLTAEAELKGMGAPLEVFLDPYEDVRIVLTDIINRGFAKKKAATQIGERGSQAVGGTSTEFARKLATVKAVEGLQSKGSEYLRFTGTGQVPKGWKKLDRETFGVSLQDYAVPEEVYNTVKAEFDEILEAIGEADSQFAARATKEQKKSLGKFVDAGLTRFASMRKWALLNFPGSRATDMFSNTVNSMIGLGEKGGNIRRFIANAPQRISEAREFRINRKPNARLREIIDADPAFLNTSLTSIGPAAGRSSRDISGAGGYVVEIGSKLYIVKPREIFNRVGNFSLNKAQDWELGHKVAMVDAFQAQGHSLKDAVKLTQDYIFNYNDVPKWLGWMDQRGIFPFSRFQWQAAAMTARFLRNHPEAIIKYPRFHDKVIQYSVGEEEWNNLPEYQKSLFTYPIGRDANGRMRWIDLSKYLVMGGAINMASKELKAISEGQLLPDDAWVSLLKSNFYTDIGATLLGQQLPFEGELDTRDISLPGDPDKWAQRRGKLLETLSPVIRSYNSVRDAMNGMTPSDFKFSEPKNPRELLFQFATGIRLTPSESKMQKDSKLWPQVVRRVEAAQPIIDAASAQWRTKPNSVAPYGEYKKWAQQFTERRKLDAQFYKIREFFETLRSSGRIVNDKGQVVDAERLKRAVWRVEALLDRARELDQTPSATPTSGSASIRQENQQLMDSLLAGGK